MSRVQGSRKGCANRRVTLDSDQLAGGPRGRVCETTALVLAGWHSRVAGPFEDPRGGADVPCLRDRRARAQPFAALALSIAFVQGELTLARTEGGLGLGLALVKGITELHGGTVRAESAGKGKGAEFIVRTPRRARRHSGPGTRRRHPSAVEKAQANPPDVVLCDIGLSGMSGY